MAQDEIQALRAEADALERAAHQKEDASTSSDNCGCKIAGGVARGVATVALSAALGLPISL